jgi:hypothetical protein
MIKIRNHKPRLCLPNGGIMAIAVVLILLVGPIGTALAMTEHRYDGGSSGPLYKTAVTPNKQLRVHRVSNVNFSITNYGMFGSQGREVIDSLTGELAPSCEFPAGSNLEYLFQGSLWIGAVVERPNNPGVFDTLVSIGNDGWWGDLFELYPATPPGGNILMLSKRGQNAPPYADSVGSIPNDLVGRTFHAVSEQDLISVFYDTNTTAPSVDPNDGRQHRPLGLRIVQKSYSWSYEYAEDFILIDFEISNIGNAALKNVWIGLYIDADVWQISEDTHNDPEAGAQDDICGFLRYYVDRNNDSTEIFTAWIADNNGLGVASAPSFDALSARGVSGCRVVRAPTDSLEYGFNWWISNMTSAFDWGPMTNHNDSVLNRLFPTGVFPGGGKGTPGGDRAKYYEMSNGEFDYDQIYCNIDTVGWVDNTSQDPNDLANGYDTRYLYSFGPFDSIAAGATLPLTVGYICGANLHRDPMNYQQSLRTHTAERQYVDRYYRNLNFSDFATNAQWAEWVYDNPGRDSCFEDGIWSVDGDSGEFEWVYSNNHLDSSKFWIKGDGCPDFQGPPPPPSPVLEVSTDKGHVDIRWSSKNPPGYGPSPEEFIDPFSARKDFEGYEIYLSYDEQNWIPRGHYDRIDFVPVTKDTTVNPPVWVVNKEKIFPLTRDSVLMVDPNAIFGRPIDTLNVYKYWIAQDLNLGLDAIIESREEVTPGDTVYHYRFTIDSLQESRGVYFAVSAFDFGNPQTDLSPLESARSINSTLVYPVRKTDPIMVYPNPYRIDGQYAELGYEDPDNSGWHEQDRRLWFSNLPDDQWAIIRIWTLDGDLIRAITYDPRNSIGNPPGIVSWDLISRNTQAVVSGMYLFSVEYHSINGGSNKKSEIGKFVIIK